MLMDNVYPSHESSSQEQSMEGMKWFFPEDELEREQKSPGLTAEQTADGGIIFASVPESEPPETPGQEDAPVAPGDRTEKNLSPKEIVDYFTREAKDEANKENNLHKLYDAAQAQRERGRAA